MTQSGTPTPNAEPRTEKAAGSQAGSVRPVAIGPMAVQIRGAVPGEADELADLWLRARAASAPSVPAPIHDDEEVRTWFRAVVVPEHEVLVAVVEERVVGLLVLGDGTVEQLYVDPALTSRRLGTLLLEAAKARFPDGLELWTFEANTGARRFYERHGFVAIERQSDHSEEGPPDLRYRWP